MIQTTAFECSICGEASTEICAWCAKDACDNHLCRRCRRCSDCCQCDTPLSSEPEALPVEESAAGLPAPDSGDRS